MRANSMEAGGAGKCPPSQSARNMHDLLILEAWAALTGKCACLREKGI